LSFPSLVTLTTRYIQTRELTGAGGSDDKLNKELLDAATGGDIAQVTQLILLGADVNYANNVSQCWTGINIFHIIHLTLDVILLPSE
jgi:hypothetical protein